LLTYPQIDPVIVALGPLQIRWYSLMYVIGLVAAYFYLRSSSRRGTLKLTEAEIENVMLSGLVGMIVGARFTYVFVYNFDHYMAHPDEILATWKGGLSFHGAVVGIALAVLFYCKRIGKSYFNVMDHLATITPVGLGFGRIGNFINGELWGRVTDAPIGMVFPDGGSLPRHPSQLYESMFEGWVLLACMFLIAKTKPREGVLSSLFLMLYATFRFFIEFFREPDSQLGTVLGPFSMGQILCAIMWSLGGILLTIHLQRPKTPETAA
jgi:phosphatidylglycerol---prolipoprotein diacylglyceryl transferase